ncbi:MAG: Nuclear transport factor 2 family protein [Thermoproteota archaeon]|nr:Nuclear transport factor 2 family protein [Thermoproteota archaeon]
MAGKSLDAEDSKTVIRSFYKALSNKDVGKALSFITDDAILVWGPFTFRGREEIRKWMVELGELAIGLQFGEKSLAAQGSMITSEFFMGILTNDGERGLIPCNGLFEFKSGKIQQIRITLSYGYVLMK